MLIHTNLKNANFMNMKHGILAGTFATVLLFTACKKTTIQKKQ